MARKVIKSDKCPQWSRAKYFAFIRSGLRRLWSKYPIKFEVKKKVRRKSQSSNKRLKWEFSCAICKGWFPDKFTTVDHLEPCGSLSSYDDLPRFVEKLLCGEDNLQVLCDSCHQLKTNKERSDKKVK